MKDLILKVITVFELNSRIRGIKIIPKIADNIPKFINTDANRVRQVAFNLISNAMKFTYTG